eukprot:2426136-Alexandrium_andersonii.AAC.1
MTAYSLVPFCRFVPAWSPAAHLPPPVPDRHSALRFYPRGVARGDGRCAVGLQHAPAALGGRPVVPLRLELR